MNSDCRFVKTLNWSTSPERLQFLKKQQLLEELKDLESEYVKLGGSAEVQKLSSLEEEYETMVSNLNNLEISEQQKKVLQSELSDISKNLLFSEKSYEYWKEVLNLTNSFYLSDLSSMLTDCFRAIYQKDNISIVLVPEEYRNKQIIKIKFDVVIDGVHYIEEFNGQAGSIKTVLGLVMSIYYIILMDLPRIVFIDETLASLDIDILHRTLDVLKKFTQKFGFAFLCISHHGQYLRDYIDKAYSINKEGVYYEITPEEVV